MEVCIPFNTSAGPDISSNRGSLTDLHYLSHCDSRNHSVNDLERCLTQYLNIEDNKISTSRPNFNPTKNGAVNLEMEDKHNDLDESKSSNSASEKCFSNCATFPPLGDPKSLIDGLSCVPQKLEDDKLAEISAINEHDKSVNQCCSCSISPPTPFKIVSAMKGSRVKQGMEPKKLSVTWAPDVYDPIPTSVSHVPSSKNYRHRSDGKKYGNNKQSTGSSKSSRGKSKDKKQPRKSSGSSTNKSRPLRRNNGVVGFSESQGRFIDYNNDVSLDLDPFCGSSFLKKSVSKLHFTVAEAT